MKEVGMDTWWVGKKLSGEWGGLFCGVDCGAVSLFWNMKEVQRWVIIGAEVFRSRGCSIWSSSDSGSESDCESKLSLGGGEGLFTCSAGVELDGC